MTSFGIGELLVVLVLSLLAFDIKHIGKAFKWISSMRSKFFNLQNDWKSQLEQMIQDQDAQEVLEKNIHSVSGMRKWGHDRLHSQPAMNRYQASQEIMDQLKDFEPYKKAKVVACYSSLYDELDTSYLLKKILEDKKAVWLPYITKKDKVSEMKFAPIETLGKDTTPGVLGILEPLKELQKKEELPIDLYFVPGRCFDEEGGRIGRGKGFYDRYLHGKKGIRVGLGFDVQISTKKLSLEPHDESMDYILTEKRMINDKKNTEQSKDSEGET